MSHRKEAQPCYCGSSNCSGFIGGDKKRELTNGFEDGEESDSDASGKTRRKKSDDSSLRDTVRPYESEDELPKLVRTLMYPVSQVKHVRRVIERLSYTESSLMLRKFLRLHGLVVLRTCLQSFAQHDISVCCQVLSIEFLILNISMV